MPASTQLTPRRTWRLLNVRRRDEQLNVFLDMVRQLKAADPSLPLPPNLGRVAYLLQLAAAQQTLRQSAVSLTLLLPLAFAAQLANAALGYMIGGNVWLLMVGLLGLNLRNRRSLVPLGLLVVTLGYALVLAMGGRASTPQDLAVGLASAALLLAMTFLLLPIAVRIVNRFDPVPIHPYLMVVMTEAAYLAVVEQSASNERGWRPRSRLALHLAATATALSSGAVGFPGQWRSGPVREALDDWTSRVAGGFATLAGAAAIADDVTAPAAIRQRALADTRASVVAGYVAMCEGRWQDLALAEPAARRRPTWPAIVTRVAVALVLVAVAIWVVPQVLTQQNVALTQSLLITSALVALLDPRQALTSLQGQVVGALRR